MTDRRTVRGARQARVAAAVVVVLGAASIAMTTAVTASPRTAIRSAAASSCRWMRPGQSADQRARELVAAMTLKQKIAELYGRGEDVHYGSANYIPPVPSLCIPAMVFNDAGDGIGDSQTGATAFPDGIAQAASWNRALQQTYGSALGRQARQKGINVQLAPALDVTRNPLAGRSFEYAGEDPYLSGQTGVALIRGIQSQHVVAVAKHFALNDQETDRMGNSSDASTRTMQEIDLPPFEAAVKQGHVGSVMCSYNLVNNVYACQDKYLLTTVLRKQFGFQGWVMSDWLATHSTAQAAKAGLDQEQSVVPGTYFSGALRKAVQAGQVSRHQINLMVLSIMRPLFQIGLFDHPLPAQPAASLANLDTTSQQRLARKVGDQGAVLLKNTRHALPLTTHGQTIAVIGYPAGDAGAQDYYQAGGSSKVPGTVPDAGVVSPLSGITTRALALGDTVTYSPAVTTTDAATVAKNADLAVVVVGDGESEGVDRTTLAADNQTCGDIGGCTQNPGANQDQVVAAVAKANPNTIVVLQTGGPVSMPWLSSVRGVLETWYPGEQDGNVVADLLFGRVDPGGKLPYTFPRSMKQTPIRSKSQWPGVTGPNGTTASHYREGLLVGYRWYDAKHITPLFPFGFGLSYTHFSMSKLRVHAAGPTVAVRFTVRNTGTRAGAVVPQLYVSDPKASGEPPLQLKGFRHVSLQPGAHRTVTIRLGRRSFSYWAGAHRQWQVTPGCYAIHVGDSSSHLPLSGSVARGGGSCH